MPKVLKAWQVEPGMSILFSDSIYREVEWISDKEDSYSVYHCGDKCMGRYSDEDVTVL